MSAAAGSIACARCTDGEFTHGNGSVSCSECIPGTFKANASEVCIPCPQGFASAAKAATSCSLCGPGTFATENGSTSCLSCRPGRFKSAGSHILSCLDCPSGFVTETEGQTACTLCELASYTTENGMSACIMCDIGKFGAQEGVCTECPPGTFQDEKKMTTCKLCPMSRYSTEFGATAQAQCTFCALDRTTGNVTGASHISACQCREWDFYEQDPEEAVDATASQLPACTACPSGANCPVPGSRLVNLYAKHFFWQPENITANFIDCASAFADRNLAEMAQMRCCPESAECHRVPRSRNWTVDDQCERGYSGPLCTSCAQNYVLFGGECIACDGGSPLWAGVVGLFAVALGLFVASLVMLRRVTKFDEHTEETRMSRVLGLVSILISWLQILSALTVTYKLAWPADFAAYSKGTGAVVNLEVFSFLAISNCALAVPFINKFLLQILTPPIFIGAVVLAWLVVKICFRPKKKGRRKQVQQARSAAAVELCILIVQLMYPKLCTRTFQMFRCVDLGDRIGMLLEADFSKRCYEGVHAEYVPLAVVSMVVYLVGVPLATFAVIWRHRGRLHTRMVESLYGDLYRQYEDSWAFWEVCLQIQKCMLTGAMVAIAPGSSAQLLIAMLVCLAYLLLVLHAAPFKGQLEDRLAFLVSLCLTVSLTLGFALITDKPEENAVYDPPTIGVILILINLVPFLYGGVAFAQILRRGPNYAISGQGAATETGRCISGGEKKSVNLAEGSQRRRGNRQQVRIKRQLSILDVKKAVTHEQVVMLQNTSNEHRQAHIARVKAREAKADARVRARLAERAKLRAKREQDGVASWEVPRKSARAGSTSVMPVVEKTGKKSPVGIPDGAMNTLRSTVATKIKSYKRLVKVFGKLDRDGSGTLSRAEFRQLLKAALGSTPEEMLCLAAWEVVWGQRPHAEKDEVDAPALARWLGFAPEEENAEKKRRKNKKNKEKGAGGLNIREWTASSNPESGSVAAGDAFAGRRKKNFQ